MPSPRIASSPLFVKVFAWFWLVVFTMAAALLVTLRSIDTEVIGFRWTPAVPDASIRPRAVAAAEAFERGGPQGFAQFVAPLLPTKPMTAYLFDPRGRELTGAHPPRGAVELAAHAETDREIQVKLSVNRTLVGCWVTLGDARRYRFVLDAPRGLIALFPVFGEAWLWAIGSALLTLTALCYAIARNLTAPVLQVRSAARRIAEGDLTARAGDRRMARRKDEFTDLAHDFDAMAARIESLVESKQRLLWDISHELRSPLTRVGLALGMAQRKAGPDAAASLDRIERETEQLNRLIEQLLTLARITGGTGPSLTEQVDLADVVRQVAADAEFEASGLNKSVRTETDGEARVAGARELLQSAVENVVRNALRYTAEHTEIVIRLITNISDRTVVISVRDHGPGVPETSLPRLFDDFYRVPEPHVPTAPGAGLGLAITNQAVLAHGGWVKAFNDPGGGLEVQIGLPLKDPA